MPINNPPLSSGGGGAHAASHQDGGADEIASGIPDGTKFLRDDFAWASPGASSVNIKETEVDFGTAAVSEATFTITDADVSATSQILAGLAGIAPTGKEIEEVYLEEPFKIICAPAAGTFDMTVQPFGDVSDKFKIWYLVG